MKEKLVLGLFFSLLVVTVHSQVNKVSHGMKYGIIAPDGAVSITIYDDLRNNTMQLESIHSFYKYQLLDLNTSSPVYSSKNKGAKCTINKSKVPAGQYNLRVYTKYFIITSMITISHTSNLLSDNQDIIAMKD